MLVTNRLLFEVTYGASNTSDATTFTIDSCVAARAVNQDHTQRYFVYPRRLLAGILLNLIKSLEI